MPVPPNPTLAHLAAALSDDDARELVRIFLNEFPALRETLAGGTQRARYMAAHSLKSSAQHMGLEALADRAAQLETRLAAPGAVLEPADLAGLTQDFEVQAEALRAYAGD
jgi:HPt (histidine-containing phosphotransfer) domain-containing protein